MSRNGGDAHHFHCIIENLEMNACGVETMDVQITDTEMNVRVRMMDAHVGAPLRGCPETTEKCGMHNQKIRCNHWRCDGLV
ncbi:MAG: hypothetical protein H6Q14_474 [Bacteroidetes bacterium]|nr:hypothetical protein [Bacteroidota bacterium]